MFRNCMLSVYLAALVAVSTQAPAADHLDSPIVRNDPAADINDLYAFVNPNDSGELVLIKTVVPAAGMDSRFSDAVDYRFHIDNGDSSIVITCTFNGSGFQVTCRGPMGLVAAGPINRTVSGNGLRVHAGLFDDPFFFDLVAFNETKETLTAQFTDPGDDFFEPLNTLGIVLGIDTDRVSNDGAEPVLQVYTSTRRTGNTGVQPGFTGSFKGPENSLSGFNLQVLDPAPGSDADRVYATWNVYNNFGDQAWVFGVGEIDGTTVEMDAFVTDNGAFPPMSGIGEVREWGELKFTFDTCNSGQLEFSSDLPEFDASGTISLDRLTRVKARNCAFLSAGQIDRMGRPGINTVLIDLVEDNGLKDPYNTAEDPATWPQFIPEIEANLGALAGLDGDPDNQVLPAADLAPVLADDRLIIDVSVPDCDAYLAVELGVEGNCGGRTLTRDVIDDTLGAIVGPGVGDGVEFSSPIRDDFPFLGNPRDQQSSG